MPYPGDNVTMEIRAEPGSLCALGVVDRSIHVMEEPSYLSIDTVSSTYVWLYISIIIDTVWLYPLTSALTEYVQVMYSHISVLLLLVH